MKPELQVSEQLLSERIERLKFFCFDERSPRNLGSALAPNVALTVVMSWFPSRWALARWVVSETISEKRYSFGVNAFCWWHRSIMRRTEEETDARFVAWLTSKCK